MFARHISLLALTLALSTNAQAAPELRPPTSKWIVNFADAQCVATRNYGTETEPMYLVLKAPAIGDTIQLGVVRKGGRLEANQVDGDLILNDNVSLRKSFLEFGVKSMGQRAMFVNLPAKDVAQPAPSEPAFESAVREKGIERLGTRLGQGAVGERGGVRGHPDGCAAEDARHLRRGPPQDLEGLERRQGRRSERRTVGEPRATVQPGGLSGRRRVARGSRDGSRS